MNKARKIAFLDRDGTLIQEPPDEQVDRLDKITLVPGVIPALLRLRDAGYELVMVSNQDGLGTESFPEADFRLVQEFVLALFASQGLQFSEIFICPHKPADGCACRKPGTALVSAFLAASTLDLAHSFVVGDRQTDMDFAANLGIAGYLLDPADTDAWSRLADRIISQPREASVRRSTRETRIEVSVNLDREGDISIDSGIGFFDHMLEQIAKHGGFSLQLSCRGDLQVDEHHTVEDCALALGEAMRSALGDKRGIGRFGFVLPMDETQVATTLDLSGRPYLVFEGTFSRAEVGGLPTELVPHFFRSLAETLGANLHISVRGENAHHMVEACFKSLGRCLRQALARQGTSLPSTKGSL